ncbi:MAG: lipid A biosynthesis lauroyl acyltransferase [Alteromonadaceae bacterium]|nr:MAG: lipid A biosynthesis lauroyl acyltransferase [Alteromonadaceae bacterium]
MIDRHFSADIFHVKYLPTWLGVSFWWLVVQLLPYKVLMALGWVVGKLMRRFAHRRVQIAEQNLAACFPEKTAQERAALLGEIMDSLGKAVFECGMAWFWPAWRLRRVITLKGMEHIQASVDKGQGVLLLGLHFTTLEMSVKAISMTGALDGVYQKHKNIAFEYVQNRGREHLACGGVVINKRDVRGMVKRLRNLRAVLYVPDQDYGRDKSVFAPLFNISAATVTAPSKLIRLGKAAAIPYIVHRHSKGYTVEVLPPLKGLGEGDEVDDARIINTFVEQEIRRCPGQYLWVHRRFKTRPEGEPDFYKLS